MPADKLEIGEPEDKLEVPNGHPNEDDKLLSDDVEEQVAEETDEEKPAKELDDKIDKLEDEEDDEAEQPKIPFDRPTIKAIKAEFPEFFTKFPELKESYFREIEFTKLFPTVDDAKEAFQDNEAFNNLSESALSGDPLPLLESIEKTDPKAFELFSTSFLPALYKRNREAYQAAVTPIFEGLVRELHKSSDENLRNTAENVAQFLFGSDGQGILEGKLTFSKVARLSEEQNRLKQDRESKNAQGFQETYSYVEKEIDKDLEILILRDFDPNKVFSKFMRQQLAQEVIKRVKNQLSNDAAHKSVMTSRWKRAKNNGYSADDRSKIVSTFLARAKSLIPGISEKVRSLASGKQAKAADEKLARLKPVKRELNGGRVSGSAKTSLDKKDYRKMTDLEIINLD